MASLILCQWMQGAVGTRGAFGGLYWPGNSFLEEPHCKQLQSKIGVVLVVLCVCVSEREGG